MGGGACRFRGRLRACLPPRGLPGSHGLRPGDAPSRRLASQPSSLLRIAIAPDTAAPL